VTVAATTTISSAAREFNDVHARIEMSDLYREEVV
jgi:hypothetical protein